ncbi:nucleophile aminohydrolase [Paraphysoderma sedebokerense]|nr:nucleophile aminohydrolase [Paraphysoderma sedebokerense]
MLDLSFLNPPVSASSALPDSELECNNANFDLAKEMTIPKFEVPRCANPTQFLLSNTTPGPNSSEPRIKLNKGTTTLAFKYQGGVVVAVDSRATAGSYIASQSVKKVIEINPYLLGTMAGGAADCSFWERELGRRCRLYELRNKERISVAAASKLLANMVYGYKGMGLSMGTMVTGWDKTGPQIYYVDSDGQRLHSDLFSVGSGSTFAYGVLDSEYHWDMTKEEAVELGIRAIYHATHRDAYSGGVCNAYHVNREGWERIGSFDVTELHYKYQEQAKKSLV